MNNYNWNIVCRGFGTEYYGRIEAKTIKDAMQQVINQHEKGYNHYSYEVTVASINTEEKETKCKVTQGKIVSKQ